MNADFVVKTATNFCAANNRKGALKNARLENPQAFSCRILFERDDKKKESLNKEREQLVNNRNILVAKCQMIVE